MAIDIEAIRARADAATKGPWSAGGGGGYLEIRDARGQRIVKWMGFDAPDVPPEENEANATLMIATRTDIPALLEEIARLRGVVEALRNTPCGKGQAIVDAAYGLRNNGDDRPFPKLRKAAESAYDAATERMVNGE